MSPRKLKLKFICLLPDQNGGKFFVLKCNLKNVFDRNGIKIIFSLILKTILQYFSSKGKKL